MAGTLTLPEGRTESEALLAARGWKRIIWSKPARDEDQRIDALIDVCTRMLDGDKASGKELASRAIWSPS